MAPKMASDPKNSGVRNQEWEIHEISADQSFPIQELLQILTADPNLFIIALIKTLPILTENQEGLKNEILQTDLTFMFDLDWILVIVRCNMNNGVWIN